MNKWYSGEGKNSDVVVGATVRLARNLADAPFPIRMNNEIRRNTVKKIFAAVKNSPYAGEFDLVARCRAIDQQHFSIAVAHIADPQHQGFELLRCVQRVAAGRGGGGD